MDSRILLVYAIIAIVAIVALVLPVNADPAPPLSLADARVTEGTGPGSTAISFDLSTSAPQPTECGFRAVLTHVDTDDADFTTRMFDVTAVFDTDDVTLHRTFGITRDAVFEPDETMTLTVTGDGPNPCVIADGVATGTIVNDDIEPPPLSLADARVTEGTGPGSTAISFDLSTSAPQPTECGFRAVLTHVDTDDADFTTRMFDVTAVFDTDDVTLHRTFGITRDAVFEPDETMTLTVTGDGPNPCVIADGVATGTIVNDDIEPPPLSLADARVTEGTGPGSTAISFDLSTSAPQPTECGFRAVLTHVDTDDADFTTRMFDVTAVFDTDDVTLHRTFGITRDAVFEPDETMTLTVTGDGPNPCVIADGVATGTIVNDDIEPPPLSLADARVTEGTGPGSTAISFDLSTSAPQPTECGFRAVLTHVDTDDADFTTRMFDVTAVFDTDDVTLHRTFGITRDAVFEPDETMTLTVTGDGPNPCVIADGVATGTIVNDDIEPPPLSLADARVTEGTGPGSTAISFDLSTSAPQPTECGFRAVLTHVDTDDADFTTRMFDVTAVFDTDDVTLHRTFGITRDAVFEPDETMTLTVTGDGPNPCVIADGVATGTIINDDDTEPPAVPEFPLTVFPAMMIICILGVVLFIRRIR